jgi:hypothetical protein
MDRLGDRRCCPPRCGRRRGAKGSGPSGPPYIEKRLSRPSPAARGSQKCSSGHDDRLLLLEHDHRSGARSSPVEFDVAARQLRPKRRLRRDVWFGRNFSLSVRPRQGLLLALFRLSLPQLNSRAMLGGSGGNEASCQSRGSRTCSASEPRAGVGLSDASAKIRDKRSVD